MSEFTWGGSLHQTFRLIPDQSSNLKPFLESDGLAPEQVLARLPYEAARSTNPGNTTPDPKRYRDGKQVYQTAGLLYEDESKRLKVTNLGKATLRWLPIINKNNSIILGRYATYALAACQLRNPSGAGSKYDSSIEVFPFAFIWKAMLELDGLIDTEELNRGLLKVKNPDDLGRAIEKIRKYRAKRDPSILGEEVVSGKGKNDRIIPWISIASFGWVLINDKRTSKENYYEIRPEANAIISSATKIDYRHKEFETVGEYVEYVSACASLPEDLR